MAEIVKSPTIDRIQKALLLFIQRQGLKVCFAGKEMPPSEAVAENGGLPLFYEHARRMDRILSVDGETWMPGMTVVFDDKGLIDARVECRGNVQGAQAPIIALFHDALVTAMEMSPDKKTVDIACLYQSFNSEVVNELSLNNWQEVYPAAAEAPSPAN